MLKIYCHFHCNSFQFLTENCVFLRQNQMLFERINKTNTYREYLWKYFCLFVGGKHYSSNYGTSSWRSISQAVPHIAVKGLRPGKTIWHFRQICRQKSTVFFSSCPHAKICGFSGLKAGRVPRPVRRSERLVISNKEQGKYIKYLSFK